jgi:hypothetical protein
MDIQEINETLKGRICLTKSETALLFGICVTTLRRYLIRFGMYERLRHAKRIYKQDLILIQQNLYGQNEIIK